VNTSARFANSIVAAAFFTGCAGSQPPIGAPGAMQPSPVVVPQGDRGTSWMPAAAMANNPSVRRTVEPAFRIVYSFRGGREGFAPRASLLAFKGTLYGTAAGNSDVSGTVFSLTTAGAYRVLHHFTGGRDGAYPVASLIAAGGVLYGTTYFGGGIDGGTVFRINTAGQESVLHGFGSAGDGLYPEASLIAENGLLYGTTYWGGSFRCIDVGCGTVFSVDSKTGQESLLYKFQGTPTPNHTRDGAYPLSNVIKVNDVFYGTTLYGGKHGKGTIFEVSPETGKERVAYSFAGRADGAYPWAGVIDLGGMLYGTTGGASAQKGGTVYRFDPQNGTVQTLHSFSGGSDGLYPQSSLVAVKGTLYGTTVGGGGYKRCLNSHVRVYCGVVFSVTPGGVETVLHRFGATRGDGKTPVASLIYFKGALYGTTTAGGTHGRGTIFALTP
jgi:uncharacterized repeat protein (TIGR03803 family)